MIDLKLLRNVLNSRPIVASAAILAAVSVSTVSAQDAHALDLDWAGQFRVESHWLLNYSLDQGNNVVDTDRAQAGGYYIPGGGEKNAYFNTLFMRVNPSIVVNDNIYIKSEWWAGNPIFGFFGGGYPDTFDQRQFYSTQSEGSIITAQRYWAEIVTDVGTVVLGRAPVHWGLGAVWNAGYDVFDRYMSTGDQIRLVSKFGMFSFSPAYIKYSLGNNVGGACPEPGTTVTGTGICETVVGTGGVTDYSIAIKFDNPDEDLEIGVNFNKRLAGAAQGSGGILGVNGATAGMNYNIWDLYGRKDFGAIGLGVEVPITSGNIGGVGYSTFAAVAEVDWNVTDRIETGVRGGIVPGQPNIPAGADPGSFEGFFLHQSYDVGLIMFNYALRNFAGPNVPTNSGLVTSNLRSPFDSPITNAKYLSLSGGFKWTPKFKTYGNVLFATADEAATAGSRFFNHWDRRFVDVDGASAIQNQSTSLGWELDLGMSYTWDEALKFSADAGWYFPGDFYQFSNAPQANAVSSLFAAVFKVGLAF